MGKDFTNCVFGNLTAIRIVGSLNSHDDVWQCRCICGRFKDVSASDLVDGAVSNCGCHDDAAKMKDVSKEVSKADGPPKQYVSTYPGVSFNKQTQKWGAYINFKRKRYHLGHFKYMEDAIRMRKQAEKKLYNPIISLYPHELTAEERKQLHSYLKKIDKPAYVPVKAWTLD